ncbi:MAG: DUF1702 family protein [Bacteroidetes bacterium]|nr:DUF1702 family protein [Bacteroidota bacterium]
MNRNLRTRLFGISMMEATFERRGFPACASGPRQRLESIGCTFLTGYHAALQAGSMPELQTLLESVECERRGFAYEGAAMALGLLDRLTLWRRNRFEQFVAGPAFHHQYMAYVGFGWALARLRRAPARILRSMDPLIRWLALDGYGFHECYFHWKRVIQEQHVPGRLSGYERNAFDQGVGRCLWFVNGADPDRLAYSIARFDESRRADLWSGAGLACAYAGGVSDDVLLRLGDLGALYRPEIAQGVLFATETRIEAGNMCGHTERACRLLCGMTIQQASTIVNNERRRLVHGASRPAYEQWRRGIQACFREAGASADRMGSEVSIRHLTDSRSI